MRDAATTARSKYQISLAQAMDKDVYPLEGHRTPRTNFCFVIIYEYKTQDCYDLKDAIKQAIQYGKLNEFVKIIRELRNSNRKRSSPRPESRNPRNRKDDDDPIMEVAVLIGSSVVKKSKSALKKDLKVLATVQTLSPQFPMITFNKEDFAHGLADSDSPMVISAKSRTKVSS
ncbi:hypothetical protein PIB30_086448 [Stylosanthes scabra]|uniref:Uncharacterized protein n=1 Tax=Stylosanthes scabra TaxID=79078 RepID=A0ABU6WT15_9FABA|nr:hypothetical protein [Stylosanthes scabra]